VTSFFGIGLRFSRKQQDESAPKCFSQCRKKHLFITTCIEKHCAGFEVVLPYWKKFVNRKLMLT